MECPSLNTAKGSDDTFRLKLHCSYTRASWSIASQEPSPDQRGSALSLGSSLIWCALALLKQVIVGNSLQSS